MLFVKKCMLLLLFCFVLFYFVVSFFFFSFILFCFLLSCILLFPFVLFSFFFSFFVFFSFVWFGLVSVLFYLVSFDKKRPGIKDSEVFLLMQHYHVQGTNGVEFYARKKLPVAQKVFFPALEKLL